MRHRYARLAGIVICAAALAAGSASAETLTYTTPGSTEVTLPTGVARVHVVAVGGRGGGEGGGFGAVVSGDIGVLSSDVPETSPKLLIQVGGNGGIGVVGYRRLRLSHPAPRRRRRRRRRIPSARRHRQSAARPRRSRRHGGGGRRGRELDAVADGSGRRRGRRAERLRWWPWQRHKRQRMRRRRSWRRRRTAQWRRGRRERRPVRCR